MADLLNPILRNPTFILVTRLLYLFLFVLWFASIFWAWRDARRRGAMPWFWGAVALLFPFVGILVYLVLRPPELVEDARERELEIRAREAEIARNAEVCPACMKPVDIDFLICPYCMKKLRKPCIQCGRPLKLGWQVCPYCKTKQE
jgi:hypothetical protein